jgi:23S rRNA (pseudouridine1915-N3)-methyltransferase
VKVVVVAVGRLRPPYADDVQHYQRLLARHARLELIEVREDEQVARRVPERAFVSALDADGDTMDSLAFSRFLEERRRSGRDLCFVIGGPFGHRGGDSRADHWLSLGPMTLPHQLARVVLLEQLFRAHKILAGEPYHY